MKKHHKIKPQLLLNTQNALREINSLVISGNYTTVRCREICNNHKVNIAIMTFAVKAGVFERISAGKYKSNTIAIDPIHARKCIESLYGRDKNVRTLATALKEEVIHAPVPAKRKYSKRIPPPIKSKAITFLWGLFKFSF